MDATHRLAAIAVAYFAERNIWLATDLKKRELFGKLAIDLRSMVHDIQAMISTRKQEAVSHTIKAGRKAGRMVPKASR